MNDFPIGEIFSILFGLISIVLNRQFSQICLSVQKSLSGGEFEICHSEFFYI